MTERNPTALITDMLAQSMTIMTKPSVDVFERFERRGNMQQALIYVGAAALVSGIVGLLSGGLGGLLLGFLVAMVGFLVFTFLVYFIGKSQGGTGTQDEVFYTFALFQAPILVISAVLSLIGWLFGFIPILGFLVGIVVFLASVLVWILNVYYGYIAVQSSHNFKTQQQQSQALITLIGAAIAAFVINLILGAILGSILIAGAVAGGTFR
jgi:hypothetical protein